MASVLAVCASAHHGVDRPVPAYHEALPSVVETEQMPAPSARPEADGEPSKEWRERMVRPCMRVGNKMNC